MWRWIKYFELNIRGQIYFIKGNERIQITSNHLVYFYLIDKQTLIPVLENVMYNYMECSQMMIGAAKRFSVTYTSNQRQFDIFTRKYMHNFRVNVDSTNFESQKALEISSSNILLVSLTDKILIFDVITH